MFSFSVAFINIRSKKKNSQYDKYKQITELRETVSFLGIINGNIMFFIKFADMYI